jgi:2,3-bisphosphoglycerate-independent phosphoglycerate mutase
MGNSEVGHTNIGAGRVVYQELTRISKSIKDRDFFDKKEFINAIENCKNNNKKLHLMGLLSDGGVHSHNTHLYALLELAKQKGLKDVFIHCFFDGRDVPPDNSKIYVKELLEKIDEIGIGKIATIMGRYYAMDRDRRWERTKLAYDAMALGRGLTAEDVFKGIDASYERKEFDEFIKPVVIMDNGVPVAKVGRDDSIIFFNFRPDRARQITRTFIEPEFDDFERANGFFPVKFVCMTMYDRTFKNVDIAFKPQVISNTFGEYVSRLGYKQLRIAETEKYAHVTFFFNGGIEKVYEGEDRILVPSPKVATYDMKPEMSAYEVTDRVLESINAKKYDVIILNFANPDMVGHTGVFEAARQAVEVVDECVGKIVKVFLEQNGAILITADHGNSEKMIDYETGGPFTAHTTNLTPLIAVGLEDGTRLKEGRLADIAPTLLDIMKVKKPAEMTGDSLIIK